MAYEDLEMMGYEKRYDFTQWSHENDINVIPENDFKNLVLTSFKTLSEVMANTYGPYGSAMCISDEGETLTTKDGWRVFQHLKFSHQYKDLVYRAIYGICERVNSTVGDGTTSCILIADAIFNRVKDTFKTADDKRRALSILTRIEEELQDPDRIRSDIGDRVRPLTKGSLRNLIMMSANYDEGIADVMVEALGPVYDENGAITAVRNVVVDDTVDYNTAKDKFECNFLPGDYRINCYMDPKFVWVFEQPCEVRVLIYDHEFGKEQWENFMQDVDKCKEPILIIARRFAPVITDKFYADHLKQCMFRKIPNTIHLAEIRGAYVQREISDLAAVLQTQPIHLFGGPVVHSEYPLVKVSISGGNCMAFYDVESPTSYIAEVEAQRKAETRKSMVVDFSYDKRLKALRMDCPDTNLKFHSSNSLEQRIVCDKLQDCICIVESAVQYGIAPNQFAYGMTRLKEYIDNDNEDQVKEIASAIFEAICDMSRIIWRSKYGENQDEIIDAINEKRLRIYQSFDVVDETWKAVDDLPTSAQYDMEVISAAISIVKYLLTSRGLVFGSHLLTMHGDKGRYVQ